MSSERTKRQASYPVPLLLLAWLLFATLEGLLALSIDRSTLNRAVLILPVRITLICDELLALAGLLASIAFAIALIEGSMRPVLSRWRRGASMRLWLRTSLVWVLLLLYASSWAGFRSTGAFLDSEGLRFIAENFLQLVQHAAHMEPYSLLAFPLVALFLAVALVLWAPRVLAGLPARALRAYCTLVLLLVFTCSLVSLFGKRLSADDSGGVIDPTVGPLYTAGELYAEYRDRRTGPVLTVLADVRDRIRKESKIRFASEALPVTRRPIVSIKRYLRTVDATRIRKLNVVFVLVESLRADQLTIYGGARRVMPALEALSRQSRVFLNHYTQSSHSNYADLCPISSHYPLRSERTYVPEKRSPYPRALIYDVLKALGYRTAIISSQNENWGGMINYLQTEGLDHLFHSESFDGEVLVPRDDVGFEAFVKGAKRSGKIDDRFTVAHAREWIASQKRQPFYVYLNLQNSHIPYEVPADFPRPFGVDRLPFALRFNDFPRAAANLVKDRYADSLAYVDAQLGKLFEFLKEQGFWDRTVIVVSGDTGQAFYEHGFAAHANMLFDEVMRVPLLVRAPGLEPATVGRPAQHIDVPPSIFHLLGLPPHPSFQGIDLFAETPPGERSLYLLAQCPLAHQYAVVRSGLKLIYDYRRNRYWLFDLRADPGETREVSREYPKKARELMVWLDTWRKVQLDYYRLPRFYRHSYPPVLAERVSSPADGSRQQRVGFRIQGAKTLAAWLSSREAGQLD